jgi:tetratricopeptide (TPR) repeat protein
MAGRRWKTVLLTCLVGGGLLLALLGIIWMVLRPSNDLTTLDIRSEPEGVNVTIEGLITAQTPLHLGNIPPGSYTVRFEKESYDPLVQQLEISTGQAAQLAVRLQYNPALRPAEVTPENAISLFDQGRWLEASQQCDALLAADPRDEVALKLKRDIHSRLAAQAMRAMANSRWEDARTAWETALRIFPSDSEAQQQLKTVMANIRKAGSSGKSAAPSGQARIQSLHGDIAAALGAGLQLPPSAGNAWDLIKQLESAAPQDPVIREGLRPPAKSKPGPTKRLNPCCGNTRFISRKPLSIGRCATTSKTKRDAKVNKKHR